MGWILDVIFFVVLIIGIGYGAKKGFINGIVKIAGVLFSLIFAFFFCVSFADFLENTFGMTTAISNSILEGFASNELMNKVINEESITESLVQAKIPAFIANQIASNFTGSNMIPMGTTPAMLLSPLLAKWITIPISFVILFVLVFFGSKLIGWILSAFAESVPLINSINRLLGAVLGTATTGIVMFLVMMVFRLIGIPEVDDYIATSYVVSAIYQSQWFFDATNYLISFQWYQDYIVGIVT